MFQWIGDRVRGSVDWFNDFYPVKSTSEELNSGQHNGERRFGEALAEGLNMVIHPPGHLNPVCHGCWKSSNIVSKEAARAKLPAQVTQPQSATVNGDGKVVLPPRRVPAYAGMYDTGGIIPTRAVWHCRRKWPEIGRTDRQMLPAGVLLHWLCRCWRDGVAATPAGTARFIRSVCLRGHTRRSEGADSRRQLFVMR